MLELNFIPGNFDDNIGQIVRWLGSLPTNHVITFDGLFANGKAVVLELAEGLYIRVWDFSVREPTIFHTEAAPPGAPLYFTVNYLLTQDAYRINAGGDGRKYTREIKSNIVFSSNQSHFGYTVVAGTTAKALDICFSDNWLLKQFPDDKQKIETLLSLQVPGINCFLETFTIRDYELASELVQKMLSGEWNTIFVTSKIFQLLDDFMRTVFDGMIDKHSQPFNPQALQAQEIEKYLLTLLDQKLPDLDEIARRFSMSTSTLKRRFKLAFDKNIYEYYLEKKMEFAGSLLKHNGLSVTEASHRLGYEKVSSFCSAFKKHWNQTPGEFLRDPTAEKV